MARARILILGGTGDGFRLAERLHAMAECDVITSMAGVTAAPKVPAGAVRRGGFGGVDGLVNYLQAERIEALVDATHPFAAQMSRNAALAAAQAQVPAVHISRSSWEALPGDDWHNVATMTEAAAKLPSNAGTTFLTTGKTQLHHFAQRNDVTFLARTVGPLGEDEDLGPLPEKLTFIHDKGPFEVASERKLLQDYGVAWIVSKNSGGPAAYAKLEAARELGLPVIMVQRPSPPNGHCVCDAIAALRWLAANVGLNIRGMETAR